MPRHKNLKALGSTVVNIERCPGCDNSGVLDRLDNRCLITPLICRLDHIVNFYITPFPKCWSTETDIGAKEIILREIHSTPSITIKDLAKACG